ncbi:acetamidase/formamidase family protein [Comamonas sp. GB3 AK4-5]|uniref:acetamidase/formamidase family protein n=1 Tax=Comamonas sp. GB3 AK4-5 TaxID=3231487 RepID=UPI00351F55CA
MSVLHHLACSPETVVRGWLTPHARPVLHIASGDRVGIDTVNAAGLPEQDVAPWLLSQGIAPEGAVLELLAILRTVEKGPGPHVLTGPIWVEGAMPGDVLAVEVLSVAPRAPLYGINFSRPGAGSLPQLLTAPWRRLMPIHADGQSACFKPGLDLPLAPFMGIMGVSPTAPVSSIPPGLFGGNLDLKDLRPGARLYLPVQVAGGLFYTGDGHGLQAHGEANLTALECAMHCELRFVLHQRRLLIGPLAETEDDYLVLGLDADLNLAATQAVARSVGILQWAARLGVAEAYALSSLVVDFEITQLVDGVKGVHGRIPKHLLPGPEGGAGRYWGPPPVSI